MSDQLSADTIRVLRQYLEGRLSNAELEEWLVGAEYDAELSQAERDLLASIRLSLIDFQEQRTQANRVVETVAAVAAWGQPKERIVVLRTDASTTWRAGSRFTATPSRLERAGISL